ncbi:MAG: hypothetical protein AAFZ07_02990 [Actinomycetota bacterium]
MTIDVLVPTYDEAPTDFRLAAPAAALEGITIGIISNGKHGTVPFFDAFADELRGRFGVADVARLTKTNYSAPAGDDLLKQARHWHALVAGIGD